MLQKVVCNLLTFDLQLHRRSWVYEYLYDYLTVVYDFGYDLAKRRN